MDFAKDLEPGGPLSVKDLQPGAGPHLGITGAELLHGIQEGSELIKRVGYSVFR